VGLLGLVALGCTHITQQGEQIRSGLIGLPASVFRTCMPVPSDFWSVGDHDILRFRWVPELDLSPPPSGPPTALDLTRSKLPPDPTREPPPAPECELTVRLEDRRVVGVAARGRSAGGLNVDSGCLREARRCLPRS
jgi:hypothetical protein